MAKFPDVLAYIFATPVATIVSRSFEPGTLTVVPMFCPLYYLIQFIKG